MKADKIVSGEKGLKTLFSLATWSDMRLGPFMTKPKESPPKAKGAAEKARHKRQLARKARKRNK